MSARCEDVVRGFGVFSRVVHVCGAGCTQDGRKMRTGVAEDLRDSSRDSDRRGSSKEVLHVFPDRCLSFHKDDIVLLGGGLAVVVEVVDHKAVSVGGQVDVKFEKEGDQAIGGWVAC